MYFYDAGPGQYPDGESTSSQLAYCFQYHLCFDITSWRDANGMLSLLERILESSPIGEVAGIPVNKIN